MITSSYNYGVSGMQNAYQSMSRTAQDIATATTADRAAETPAAGRNLTESLVSLKMDVNLFNASARVVSAADTTLGNLLDITV